MNSYRIRTDLVLEARENVEEKQEELNGIQVEECLHEESEVRITKVSISSKNSAKILGKPMGTYITLEAPAMTEEDENFHQEISTEIADQLRKMMKKFGKEQSILVVGLGNRDVTADSLGPNVADNLRITRHMIKEFGKVSFEGKEMCELSALIPGVMAKTGMESAEILLGVVEKTKPDVVLIIDALAARSIRRLNRTIQITDTGIHPGSGVGNHRNAITEELLGVPVISIGVPTVVDAATIVNDALEQYLEKEEKGRINLRKAIFEGMPELSSLYVTGKDVDYEIKQISHILCDAIHKVSFLE